MKILVVDGEKNLRESLVELVESEGFTVNSASDGLEALLKIRANDFACIFLDIRMPKLSGLELLAKLKEEKLTKSPVIIVSAFEESSQTIEAMRLGAYDYITKPLDIDEILNALKRAVAQFTQSNATQKSGKTKLKTPQTDDSQVQIIGTSVMMREVFKQIGRVSATDATVLISGESGTGKELVAQAIHEHSVRAAKKFVAVNCGALPENLIEAELFGYEKGAFTGAVSQKKGRFEIAEGGTLFLDEIGEMPLNAQVKLLRVLQERKFERIGGTQSVNVDVRIISATNKDLPEEIKAKTFREDLFYRLNVVSIKLPALRERLDDIRQLSEFFLEKSSKKHQLPIKTFSDSAFHELSNREFAGNVRELENIVERAAVKSGVSNVVLPEHFAANNNVNSAASSDFDELFNLPFKEAIAKVEKLLIAKALANSNGNRSATARKLEINRRLLYDKIEEHKIL